MRRKFLFTTLALLISATLSSAHAADDTQGLSLKGKRIALSTVGTSIYYDSHTFQAQIDEVRRLGGTPITLDAGRNDKTLVSQLQTLVAQKPDAVIQTLGTSSVIEPWLKRISDAHIPVFTVEAPSRYSINDVTADNYAVGLQLAQKLVKDLHGKGRILVFNGFYGVKSCGLRYDALKKVLEKNPGITIVQPELRDVIPNTVQDAYGQITALLNKYPKGSIQAIWAAWDVPQLGATKALIDAKRTEILTYGVDGTPEIMNLLSQGNSPIGAVIAQQPTLAGRVAVQNVARYLAGNKNIPKVSSIPTLVATSANVAQIKKTRGD